MSDIEQNRRKYKDLSGSVLQWGKEFYYEPSIIYAWSEHESLTDYLVNVFLEASKIAYTENINIPKPFLSDNKFYNIFPGEHYRLLNAVVKITKPRVIVEIGTFTGMGAIALTQSMTDGELQTFDVNPWQNHHSHLDETIMKNRNIVQHIADLSDVDQFLKYFDLLNSADIIFIDGPKDGIFEYKLFSLLQELKPKENKLLIYDDIGFINMIDMWKNIKSPKLDATTFGHWSGTGIVDISNKLLSQYTK